MAFAFERQVAIERAVARLFPFELIMGHQPSFFVDFTQDQLGFILHLLKWNFRPLSLLFER
jgi:hypothetical protein